MTETQTYHGDTETRRKPFAACHLERVRRSNLRPGAPGRTRFWCAGVGLRPSRKIPRMCHRPCRCREFWPIPFPPHPSRMAEQCVAKVRFRGECLGRTPGSCMAREGSSGSFDSSSLPFASSGSLGVAQDDRWKVRLCWQPTTEGRRNAGAMTSFLFFPFSQVRAAASGRRRRGPSGC